MDDVLRERIGKIAIKYEHRADYYEDRKELTKSVLGTYTIDSPEYLYYIAHIDNFAPIPKGSVHNNPNNIIGTTSLTQADTLKVNVQREVISVYNSEDEKNQSRSRFIDFIIEQYEKDSYAVAYAKILPFNQQ